MRSDKTVLERKIYYMLNLESSFIINYFLSIGSQ